MDSSKFMLVPDQEFINIMKTSSGWDQITKALGYSHKPSSYTINKIKDRCKKLGVSPILNKLDPVDLETKDSLLKKRKNYQSYRSAIRKGAEKVFSESGKPLVCAVCGYDHHVEIAHIRSVSDFPGDALISDINSEDNLIALCPNHHWEYDHGILKL